MNKFLKPIIPLFIVGAMAGCANSADQPLDDYDQLDAEVVVPEVEAREESEPSEKSEEKSETKQETAEVETLETPEKEAIAVDYTYEDFIGAYALFEGEPYASNIRYALILTDSTYIDVVPEWMEYAVYEVNSAAVEENVLQFSYIMEDYTEDSIKLELKEEGTGTLLLNDEFSLYPITQGQLQAQNISLPDHFFE